MAGFQISFSTFQPLYSTLSSPLGRIGHLQTDAKALVFSTTNIFHDILSRPPRQLRVSEKPIFGGKAVEELKENLRENMEKT